MTWISVVVYAQPDCPPCEWTKEFLSRNGIEYVVKDIRADQSALDELLELGFRSTPVTIIDGVAVTGYDPDRLLELLPAKK